MTTRKKHSQIVGLLLICWERIKRVFVTSEPYPERDNEYPDQ